MKLSNIWHQKIYLLGFDMLKILEDLVTLARERKSIPVEGSYTNKLLDDKSLAKEKVLEEINELIEAVEQDTNKIHEAADVLYHLIMYFEKSGIKIEEVMKELNNRRK
jgi:phosphoribosyl-ATP pyrophosphohydrolase